MSTATTFEQDGVTRRAERRRRVVGTVLIVALAAGATTLAAALARAAGADLEVPEGAEPIPLAGFTVVTAFFSTVGALLAAALKRWSARPLRLFLRTAVALTALSLVPPLLAGADATTAAVLVGLHLVAAAVMIPALATALRARPQPWEDLARPPADGEPGFDPGAARPPQPPEGEEVGLTECWTASVARTEASSQGSPSQS